MRDQSGCTKKLNFSVLAVGWQKVVLEIKANTDIRIFGFCSYFFDVFMETNQLLKKI